KKERTEVRANSDSPRYYRNREGEVLFMDLRQKGEPFEKKFIQFSEQDIEQIAATYHNWQTYKSESKGESKGEYSKGEYSKGEYSKGEYSKGEYSKGEYSKGELKFAPTASTAPTYQNIPEYCYSATLEEIRKKDYSLVPSKYIELINRYENIDYDTQMQSLQTELKDLFQQEEALKQEVANVFKSLGYEL